MLKFKSIQGEQKMKKTYTIEVDCANCAAKIEDAVKKVSGIKDANINFMTQKLAVEFEDGADIKAVMKDAYKISKKIESDFVINI